MKIEVGEDGKRYLTTELVDVEEFRRESLAHGVTAEEFDAAVDGNAIRVALPDGWGRKLAAETNGAMT